MRKKMPQPNKRREKPHPANLRPKPNKTFKHKHKPPQEMERYQRSKYFNRFRHFSDMYNFQHNWYHWNSRAPELPQPPAKRRRSPSPSPSPGTEEYTLMKIQETSDMIKKRLSMPETEKSLEVTPSAVPSVEVASESGSKRSDGEKGVVKQNKRVMQYNVEEIHQKIISHITKLNPGKKRNLICSKSSGYDTAIQQIQKQKRLDLSKALRDMCSNQNPENCHAINAIIPDIGIRLDELPLDVIKELSSTLDMNFNDNIDIETEIHCNNDSDSFEIKQELIEISEPKINYNSLNIHIENNVESVCTNLNISVSSQTNETNFNSTSCQTESSFYELNNNVENLQDAIDVMMKIDEEILRLTKLRQTVFTKLQEKQSTNSEKKQTIEKKNDTTVETPLEDKAVQVPIIEEIPIIKQEVNEATVETSINIPYQRHVFDVLIKERDVFFENPLKLEYIPQKILVIKLIEDTLLVGSEGGKIFYVNTLDGMVMDTITVTKVAITCICYWMTAKKRQLHFLVGANDTKLREYNYETKEAVRNTPLKGPVQCMELAWNCVFVGTANGHLLRYALKQSKIEFEETISAGSVMVLKATQEGARRVLLVGMRDAPVCVRDAMSGLHLRTMIGFVTPTVYCLVLENSLVYCGTMVHGILVYNFNDGNLAFKHDATNSKGVSCMKVVENLLFASCYNGQIYVYNVKTQAFLGTVEGPGGVILSMEVVKNIIVVGTMSLNFKSVLIPDYILEHNKI